MSKLSRAEETILRNQMSIMQVLSELALHRVMSTKILQMEKRFGYTHQFVKDNGNG